MKHLLPTIILLALVAARPTHAQSPRLHDYHSLAWFRYAGTHKVSENWAIYTEAQLRRVDLFSNPQQLLLRAGAQHTLSSRVKVSGAYTYYVSYRYGKYAQVMGLPEPEHRLYEDISLSDQLGRVGLSHRLRLEQRYIGMRTIGDGTGDVDHWQYENRIRYQLAGTLPLRGATIDDHEFYLTAYDELFISFGQNVGLNVFNQNRLLGGLGYQFGKNAQLELAYLFQVLAHALPAPGTNQPVVEQNQGFRLNVVYNLDFTKGR